MHSPTRTSDERVAHVHLALYAHFMRRIHAATSMKVDGRIDSRYNGAIWIPNAAMMPTFIQTRQIVETTLFITLLHAVALLVLLHISFIHATQSPSCLSPYLPPALTTQSPTDMHLFRIEIIEPSLCLSDPPSSCLSAPTPLASFVFASRRELLALLPSSTLLQHTNLQPPINELPLIVVPRTSACFDLRWIGQSSPLWDVLLDYVLQYDTILGNHLIQWRGNGGVLLNEISGRVHDLDASAANNRSWLGQLRIKIQTLYLCISLFLMCVALVTFLSHELIARSLVLSDLLRHGDGIDAHDQLTRALGVHGTQSLTLIPIVLGMGFFFLELYKQDYVLAFGVLAVVSVGETFSMICARSPLSRRYFPRLFFCWFAVFHIYRIAYPAGFSHFALGVLAMTLLHTIMFFLNCVELPHFLNHFEFVRAPAVS